MRQQLALAMLLWPRAHAPRWQPLSHSQSSEPLLELKWELMSPIHLPGPLCCASEKITQLRQWEQSLGDRGVGPHVSMRTEPGKSVQY